jgi:xylulokinase
MHENSQTTRHCYLTINLRTNTFPETTYCFIFNTVMPTTQPTNDRGVGPELPLLLGIDVGTSSIKVSVVNADTAQCLASVQYPETEVPITSLQTGWAEQSPETWWQHTIQAIKKLNATGGFSPLQIKAIGIAYQMHGLVLVDKDQQVLRDAIIWCDSRAVETGNAAFEKIGPGKCLSSLLNSPGNFTASKLAWVKNNEPGIYEKVDKMMLPGDFIAMKLTGSITTTRSALSEGIFWDFEKNEVSKDVLEYYGLDVQTIPALAHVFSVHGTLLPQVAASLGLSPYIPISYKAGDQLNNALSLNVLEPGDVAATAGTSGVIYAVSDQLLADKFSRVNSFAHITHDPLSPGGNRIGVLLCINGTGIMNSWIKKLCGPNLSYDEINTQAVAIMPGSEGLLVLPFGNGAERMFQNKIVEAHISNIDLNKHTSAHIFRAVQEGIAFAFRYGLEILQENGLQPKVIRAGMSNLFLSEVFVTSFVNVTGLTVELFANDGSVGAALGAGIGAGIYESPAAPFTHFAPIKTIQPPARGSEIAKTYNELYYNWKSLLHKFV